MSLCAPHECRSPWRPEDVWDPQNLELQAGVNHSTWVPGTKPVSSATVVTALNHEPSLYLLCLVFNFTLLCVPVCATSVNVDM